MPRLNYSNHEQYSHSGTEPESLTTKPQPNIIISTSPMRGRDWVGGGDQPNPSLDLFSRGMK
jgi:hypothetical protein